MQNNIEEAYCSFEVSELLFKKGFTKNQVWCYYRGTSIIIDKIPSVGSKGRELGKDYIPCFTHAVAIEWLRVNFDIWISIDYIDEVAFFRYTITKITTNTILVDMINFKTPQEATEAALLHILKELI